MMPKYQFTVLPSRQGYAVTHGAFRNLDEIDLNARPGRIATHLHPVHMMHMKRSLVWIHAHEKQEDPTTRPVARLE
eukprot:3170414-Rhodomonas_salina.2